MNMGADGIIKRERRAWDKALGIPTQKGWYMGEEIANYFEEEQLDIQENQERAVTKT